MAHHGAAHRGRLLRRRHGHHLILLVGLVAGCHAPPGFEPEDMGLPRRAVLTRQLLADSAIETASHPLRSGATAMVQTADDFAAVGRGVLCKRILLRLRPTPGPVETCRSTLDPGALEACLRKTTRRDLEPAQITLYHDGSEAFAALLRLIDGACGRIDVIMFIWANDDVGWTIAHHVAARAAAGVSVRILIDGGGNLINAEPDDLPTKVINATVSWLAEQPNVQLVRVRDACAHFDHRKLVIVDGQVAWTGGRNFREQAFSAQHDLSLTVAGPLVCELTREFERSWKDNGGRKIDRPIEPVPSNANALARLVGTGPLRHDLAGALTCAIDQACHHIYVENPYLSDSRLILRLARARRRGVDVRVVLTLSAGEAIANRANRVTANFLLRAGIRVYLYEGNTHLKALTVDGAWAYTGTGNFDPLSLRRDYEVGVALSDGSIIRQIEEEVLEPDFRPEWELHEPLPITPADRLSELIASLFG